MNNIERCWESLNNDVLFILGARDFEMNIIEQVLVSAGRKFVHALSPTGERVSPRDAAAGTWILPSGVDNSAPLILVELKPNGVDALFVVDHHDNRVGIPSIAQVCTLLLTGIRGFIAGLCDHDLVQAYNLYPELTLRYRREVLGLPEESWGKSWEYIRSSLKTPSGILLNGQISPSQATSDLLIKEQMGGFFAIPSDKQSHVKFAWLGVGARPTLDELFARIRAAGLEYYYYPERGIGGFYAPPELTLNEIAEILG